MGRAYFRIQLFAYLSGKGISDKERAESFQQAVANTRNREELKELVANQVQILQGNNPYPLLERKAEYKRNSKNTVSDNYSETIRFWNKSLITVDTVVDTASLSLKL